MKPSRFLVAFAFAGALVAGAPALAQASAELADGEVRRIDAARGTLVLKHGEIKSIKMGAMTMSFKLKSPASATGLQVGDKVRFAAEQQGGELVVTRIEKAP